MSASPEFCGACADVIHALEADVEFWERLYRAEFDNVRVLGSAALGLIDVMNLDDHANPEIRGMARQMRQLVDKLDKRISRRP